MLVVAHGNSLRALMMYLDNINKEKIEHINIPTGLPRLYNFNDEHKIISAEYL